MNAEHERPIDARTKAALEELRGIVARRYPDATFSVERSIDDPYAIHLLATVDVDDTDELVDLVIERMMEIQIEDGLPIFVIPMQPPERVAEWLRTRPRQELPPMPIAPA